MYDKVFLNEYGFYELKKKPSLSSRKKILRILIIKSLREIMSSSIVKKKNDFLKVNTDKKSV